jgi:hypothetical protein
MMIEDGKYKALRLNVGLDAEQELFYMRVLWQMERERERAIKRGHELDAALKAMNQVPNVKVRGCALLRSPS